MDRNKKYARGSEWRKWDLHLHSFYTSINNNFGNIVDKYIEKIVNHNIGVVGLTNYFNFSDDDFNLKTQLESKGITVFLNLELRLTYQNKEDKCLDFHILFSNEVDKNTIDTFLTKLNAIMGDGTSKTLKDIKKTDEKEKAVVEFTCIEDLLYKDDSLKGLRDKILLGFLSRGHGNSRSATTYSRLAEKCDFLVHSTDISNTIEQDREFWLKQGKPLLNSSDAHTIDNIGSKFTWIKADPTFEGLRQIVYEPENRVAIQELKPEEKEGYHTIDRVQFIDKDNSFIPKEILLSKNLTTIIGGKSTGKSVLLRNIAQTIDEGEVEARIKEVGIDVYKGYDNDFSVVWGDQQHNRKSDAVNKSKKIIYIPQSYLNRLFDKKEETTSIDQIVRDILEQDVDVKNAFNNLENKNRELEKCITQCIEDFFYKEQDIDRLTVSIKNIGDKKGIESEVGKLKLEVSDLKKKSGMSDEDIKQYNDLSQKMSDETKKLNSIKNEIKSMRNFDSQKIFNITSNTESILDTLSDKRKNDLVGYVNNILDEIHVKWLKKVTEELMILEKDAKECEQRFLSYNKDHAPLLEKLKKSQALNEKIKKLESEEKKLDTIIIEAKRLFTLKKEHDDLLENIIDKHSKFLVNFFNAKDGILKQKNISKDHNLGFNIEVRFQAEAFTKNLIDDVFDKRVIVNFTEVDLRNYQYSQKEFKQDIKKIARGILDDKINLKSSYSKKEAITKLMKSWFIFKYIIKEGNDEMSTMSPGKKSYVLLKLLIELDNSRCPILLDQPEDDLDNRSIYYDLVEFIKKKKKERQIIIVTHNPNLVVGSDTECVIVANQDGDKTRNEKYKFEYVQGALEDSFINENSKYVLLQKGVRQHVCDILEGGETAFEKRQKKYNIN